MSEQTDNNSEFTTVVGIAASAGGLEAMSLLAQHLPNNLPCTYVLAKHMSPHHASVLSTLLARETRLTVKTVDGTVPLLPNTIYVPEPKTDLVVEKGEVTACEPSGVPGAPKPSADRLFSSIAMAYGESSVGIVLSGTGSDGSYGVQDIREAGGITIAQDPASCKYDTMPSSAVQTGCVDLILSPRQMGEQLKNILLRPRDFSKLQEEIENPNEYDDLFRMLMAQTKVNFRHYKENTVTRRIQRRMIALGYEDYASYVAFCKDNPTELEALYREFLISVTRFFRDPEQFEALKSALTSYVRGGEDRPIRVWVAGCATGEEAYSIAFLLCDLLGVPAKSTERRIQIFATDLDEAALTRARAGSYPAAASAGLPHEMLTKYFTSTDDVLKVKPEIRSLILFSRHNVFQDPPFSDIDLVSFRNTMIYFDAPMQEKVMSRLLYALRPRGYLFLGTSETIGLLEPYFERSQGGAKLFRKRSNASFDHKALVRFGMPSARERSRVPAVGPIDAAQDEELEMFGLLAAAVAPTGILVNQTKDIVRIFGDISEFCRVTDDVRGRLTVNTLKQELSSEAASLIPLCLKHGKARNGTWRDMDGKGFNQVRMRAYPLIKSGQASQMVLVAFETTLVEETQDKAVPSSHDHGYFSYIESELADAREALQITMEELQTSNEELQSTNEELQSSNEELQSTNEELETSNEELQSTNEELITVNEELLINSDELNRVVSEQAATLAEMPVPLLVVDRRLNIKSASKYAAKLFGLSERGAHLGHISQAVMPKGFPPLIDICADVLTKSVTRIETFQRDGLPAELRVAPFYIKDAEMVGLTITIWSSHEVMSKLQGRMSDRLQFFTQVLGDNEGIGVYDFDMLTGTVWWSQKLYEMTGRPLDKPLNGYEDAMTCHHPDEIERANSIVEKAIAGDGKFHYFARGLRGKAEYILESSGVVLFSEAGDPIRILGTARDFSAYESQGLLSYIAEDVLSELEKGFFFWDVANEFYFLSEFAADMLELPIGVSSGREAIRGRASPGDRDRLLQFLKTAAESEGLHQDLFAFEMPSGRCLDIRLKLRRGVIGTSETKVVYGSVRVIQETIKH